MSDEDNEVPFLHLPFDWFVLENWHNSDPIEDCPRRREKHLALGRRYAELGYEGRRPYAIRAHNFRTNEHEKPNLLNFRPIPTDLLNPTERKLSEIIDSTPDHANRTILIRTSYGPDSDEIFRSLVEEFLEIPPSPNFDEVPILSDPLRYDFKDADADEALKMTYAFFPGLVEPACHNYEEEEEPFEGEVIQFQLFATNATNLTAEEVATGCMCAFFIADEIAMRSGMLRWVFPDQFGSAWAWDERVSAEMLRLAVEAGQSISCELRKWIEQGTFGDFEGWKKREGRVEGLGIE